MSHLTTAQADDAHAAATRDRSTSADLILTLAVREAIDAIRAGRPGWAEYRLTRVGLRAERILGRTS